MGIAASLDRAPDDTVPVPVRQMVTVVATVILNQYNQVLLKERLNPLDGNGLWTLFGGKVDAGETLLEATVREIGEETNLWLPAERYTQVCFDEGATPQGLKFVMLYSQVRASNHELSNLQNMEPTKCSGMKWFRCIDLPPNMWVHDRRAIEKCFDPQMTLQM